MVYSEGGRVYLEVGPYSNCNCIVTTLFYSLFTPWNFKKINVSGSSIQSAVSGAFPCNRDNRDREAAKVLRNALD